ncbi:MAG: S1 RNA-binding domain-containing protein, partial [Acidobacteriota bacterium]|nr:S1 RNA-binding domain-containing protein [Acidobacteriota bacterium]
VDGHSVGDDIVGRVVNVTDFGLFIDVYDGLEGLAHVSEVDVPGGKLEDHYRIGEFVRARILRIEDEDKKVGLTLRGVTELSDEEAEELSAERERKLAEARAAAAAAEEEAEEEDVASEVEASEAEEPAEAATEDGAEDIAEMSAAPAEGDEVEEADEAADEAGPEAAASEGPSDEEPEGTG